MHGQPHIGCYYVNLHKLCTRKITKIEGPKHVNMANLQQISCFVQKLCYFETGCLSIQCADVSNIDVICT